MKKSAFKFQFSVFSPLFILVAGYCLLVTLAYAKEITLIYTGETHAMLYPCFCPKEPDGGIARRATLIKQLRKRYPYTLLLDSGGFFAAGLMDEYTLNTELDKNRTEVNLKAMELMGYDAVALGDDEFNFGREFLESKIKNTRLTFVSCNIKSDNLSPYIIKEVAGTKIGIIGVTGIFAMSKAEGLKFLEPKIAVRQAIEQLKKSGADMIILLSHQGEEEDIRLLNEVLGIDILITAHSRSKEEPVSKIGETLILRPSWQGRRLGVLSLSIEENKIKNYKVEELRLSEKIADDPEILKILPRCYSDRDCREKNITGMCVDAGELTARCIFSPPVPLKLLIITPKSCRVCNTQPVIDYLKRHLPGLFTSYIYYPSQEAEKMLKNLPVKGLPVYLLEEKVEKEKSFSLIKDNLERHTNFYLVKPQFSGISYFLERKQIKGKLDLFISLYDKDTSRLLEAIRGFNPQVHFLAIEEDKHKFDAARGNLEVEEYLRAVCVDKYYPKFFWDYLICRAKNINSSWWEDCLGELDALRIRTCAKSEEAEALLRENIRLNKQIEVMFGPVYLLENQEVFSTEGVPTKEELSKIIKR
ncbi:MAG: metallophosphatase [Candidatus Omnitrophica bacterium]|nr:metallophosphatase [Candidatus Omnitrophota bacterium]